MGGGSPNLLLYNCCDEAFINATQQILLGAIDYYNFIAMNLMNTVLAPHCMDL